MIKNLVNKLFGGKAAKSSTDGFFLNVRCHECREHFHLFINKSWDLMQKFDKNGGVTYALNKEIVGVGCKNRIKVSMHFDSRKNLVSRTIERGEFVEKLP